MVTKISGSDMIHVENLAFKVIKYLLDNIISGKISVEDIEKMRKKHVSKGENNKSLTRCKVCEKTLANQPGLKLHMTRMHKKSVACDLCELLFVNFEDLEDHQQTTHIDEYPPVSKRMKMKGRRICKETDVGDEEMMDVDDDLTMRSKMNDEKVFQLQNRFEKEDKKVKEQFRMKEVSLIEEERKRR